MKFLEIENEFKKILALKNKADSTINSYLNCFYKFKKDKKYWSEISSAELENYLLQFKNEYCISYYNQMLTTLRVVYSEILNQPRKLKRLKCLQSTKTVKDVIHPDDFWNAYDSLSNQKHRAILLLLWSTGCRISELLNIKLSDIQRQHGRIKLSKTKGNKERFIPLKNTLLDQIKIYYRSEKLKPKTFLFEGPTGKRYSPSSVDKILKRLNKSWHPHLFRHTYFTFLNANGVNVFDSMNIAGHASIKSQMQYVHIDPSIMNRIPDNTVRI